MIYNPTNASEYKSMIEGAQSGDLIYVDPTDNFVLTTTVDVADGVEVEIDGIVTKTGTGGPLHDMNGAIDAYFHGDGTINVHGGHAFYALDNADGVRIDGLTFLGDSQTTGEGGFAVYFEGSDGVRLTNNSLEYMGGGLSVIGDDILMDSNTLYRVSSSNIFASGDTIDIWRNDITESGFANVDIGVGNGDAIQIGNSSDVNIGWNTIFKGFCYAINLWSGGVDVETHDNTVSYDITTGLNLAGWASFTSTNDSFNDNGRGIVVDTVADFTIDGAYMFDDDIYASDSFGDVIDTTMWREGIVEAGTSVVNESGNTHNGPTLSSPNTAPDMPNLAIGAWANGVVDFDRWDLTTPLADPNGDFLTFQGYDGATPENNFGWILAQPGSLGLNGFLASGSDTISIRATDTSGAHDTFTVTASALDSGVLFGSNLTEIVAGADGNDVLGWGTANDKLDGGIGVDRALYSGVSSAVTIHLTNGTVGGAVTNTLQSIENATGSSYNDTIYGANGVDNLLEGGSGADTLFGFGGDDTLVGGSGNDVFYFITGGSQGADVVNDFTSGDKINMEDYNYANFGSINIADDGNGDAVITHAHGTIRLDGVATSSLTSGDFIL